MRAHAVWCGRMPACSMSGFVRTMPVRSRAARRASPGRVAVVDDRAGLEPARAHELAERRPPDRARAPSSGRGRARGRRDPRACVARTGRWKQKLLPLAVGVATTSARVRGSRAAMNAAPGARRARSRRDRGARTRAGSAGREGAARSSGPAPGTVSSAVRHGLTIRLSSQSSTTESTPRGAFPGDPALRASEARLAAGSC